MQTSLMNERPPAALPSTSDSSIWANRIGEQLLRELHQRPITQEIKVLYQIGAHKFQEKQMLLRLFPRMQKVVLFEPNPSLAQFLREQNENDSRVQVLPYALADKSGEATFFIASNAGLSSSLLALGKHRDVFPTVNYQDTISVTVKTLGEAVTEHNLRSPDMLFIDAQGAEFRVLCGLPPSFRKTVKLIYLEASLEEFYQGAKLLNDLKTLLSEDFLFVGYAPQEATIPGHGNALFINRCCRELLDKNFFLYWRKRLFR